MSDNPLGDNPYSTPANVNFGITREEALAKVKLPATLLLLTAVFSFLGSALTAGMPFFMPPVLQTLMEQADQEGELTDEQAQQMQDAINALSGPLSFISGGIGLIGAVLMFIGALKMKQLESYGLSMTACIVAIVPYLSACCTCIFPIAVGIWGIVVISSQDVKSHFN